MQNSPRNLSCAPGLIVLTARYRRRSSGRWRATRAGGTARSSLTANIGVGLTLLGNKVIIVDSKEVERLEDVLIPLPRECPRPGSMPAASPRTSVTAGFAANLSGTRRNRQIIDRFTAQSGGRTGCINDLISLIGEKQLDVADVTLVLLDECRPATFRRFLCQA